MLVTIAQITTFIIAVFVLVGGIIGFKKAGSKASLFSGVASAILLAIFGALSYAQPLVGLGGSMFTMVALQVVFALRFKKTKKFMPAGMLFIICLFGEVIVLSAVLNVAGIISFEPHVHSEPLRDSIR